MIDFKKFFNEIRPHFKLTSKNVAGFEFIILTAVSMKIERDNLAYALATSWLETAHTMQPIRERGGKAYFRRMYDIEGDRPHIAKRLGNTKPGDGEKYPGGGLAMITGKRNYRVAGKKMGVDFVKNPHLVLEPKWAVQILFIGMQEGWFTGKRFSSYIDGIDESDAEDFREFKNARRIINGVDRAGDIAGYALKFQAALIAAGYSTEMPGPPDVPIADDVPKVPGLNKPMAKSKTFWGAIAGFFSSAFAIFGGLDWRVQMALLAVVAVAGWLIISERVKYRDIARRLGL